MTRRALLACCGVLVACDVAEPASVALGNPQALQVDCPAAPENLSARLWVSGYDEAIALEFDAAAGTTRGTVDIAPGVVRKLTLDWFVPLGRSDEVDLVLAQAQGELPLVDNAQATAELSLTEDAIVDTGCKDMRQDSFTGSSTIRLDGSDVPVCDLDNSCSGGDPATCTNLVETCRGSDPLDPTVEP